MLRSQAQETCKGRKSDSSETSIQSGCCAETAPPRMASGRTLKDEDFAGQGRTPATETRPGSARIAEPGRFFFRPIEAFSQQSFIRQE